MPVLVSCRPESPQSPSPILAWSQLVQSSWAAREGRPPRVALGLYREGNASQSPDQRSSFTSPAAALRLTRRPLKRSKAEGMARQSPMGLSWETATRSHVECGLYIGTAGNGVAMVCWLSKAMLLHFNFRFAKPGQSEALWPLLGPAHLSKLPLSPPSVPWSSFVYQHSSYMVETVRACSLAVSIFLFHCR
jgi:hypothetical protein